MSEELLKHSGVRDWHFCKIKVRKVLEFQELREKKSAYLLQHAPANLTDLSNDGVKPDPSWRPPADYADRVMQFRLEEMAWLFEHLVRTASGDKRDNLCDPETIADELDWDEFEDLEEAATDFLARGKRKKQEE